MQPDWVLVLNIPIGVLSSNPSISLLLSLARRLPKPHRAYGADVNSLAMPDISLRRSQIVNSLGRLQILSRSPNSTEKANQSHPPSSFADSDHEDIYRIDQVYNAIDALPRGPEAFFTSFTKRGLPIADESPFERSLEKDDL